MSGNLGKKSSQLDNDKTLAGGKKLEGKLGKTSVLEGGGRVTYDSYEVNKNGNVTNIYSSRGEIVAISNVEQVYGQYDDPVAAATKDGFVVVTDEHYVRLVVAAQDQAENKENGGSNSQQETQEQERRFRGRH